MAHTKPWFSVISIFHFILYNNAARLSIVLLQKVLDQMKHFNFHMCGYRGWKRERKLNRAARWEK